MLFYFLSLLLVNYLTDRHGQIMTPMFPFAYLIERIYGANSA